MGEMDGGPAAVVHAVNDAWLEGRAEEMRPHLAHDVVFVQPGFEARVVGPDDVIASYQEFAALATLHGYNETEATVEDFGETAVVSYFFTIAYEMDGRQHRESGHDLFVLTRREGAWKVAWRTLVPAA